MDVNHAFLNTFLDVSEESYKQLLELSTIRDLKAGDQVSKNGEVPTKIYLLVSGTMRAYLSSKEGKEYTKSFFTAFSFVGSLTALVQKCPSKLIYEALTDCKVYELNFANFKELCNKDLNISALYNKVLEHIFIKYEERQLELISMDATARYLKLQKEMPDIEKVLPQFQIASFLSITPVQLSRIRKKLKSQ
ncbi:Crp/Fnr family transcriptional regulator [Pseudotamlana agarivorans]|uniref:Crp/Fnr family transcriptional regulator n=1 Tax=Pseudotamlana agarivorans TaxID=481183 RepID=UPI00082C5F51|nr:Crp/Fnr family transcriptional regulator [Tamlana agarivorans]